VIVIAGQKQSDGSVVAPAINVGMTGLHRRCDRIAVVIALVSAFMEGPRAPGDPLLRNPITGSLGCCDHVASGHSIVGAADTPPSTPINSRRLMLAPH
jgi:hypothetical protein